MNRLSSTHARSGPNASTLNFLMTLFLCAMALPFVVTVAVIGFPFLVILGSLLGGPLVIFFLVRYLAFEIKVPVLYHGMCLLMKILPRNALEMVIKFNRLKFLKHFDLAMFSAKFHEKMGGCVASIMSYKNSMSEKPHDDLLMVRTMGQQSVEIGEARLGEGRIRRSPSCKDIDIFEKYGNSYPSLLAWLKSSCGKYASRNVIAHRLWKKEEKTTIIDDKGKAKLLSKNTLSPHTHTETLPPST